MEPSDKESLPMHRPSAFVDYVAKISVVVGAYLVFDGIMNVRFILAMKDRPEFALAEQLVPSGLLSPGEMMFEIVLQMVGIAAAVAMLRRKNWGRILYLNILSVLTITGIVSSVRTYLSMSEYFRMLGLGSSLTLLIIAYIAAIGINLVVIWKLTREQVRKEFLPASQLHDLQ